MHCLKIENFQINLKIGVPDAEREQTQQLYLNIEINCNAPVPQAELSDDIADVDVDYDKLLNQVRAVEKAEFKLIEHCAAEIYTIVRANVEQEDCTITIEIHKYPDIKGLIGGVKYKISR